MKWIEGFKRSTMLGIVEDGHYEVTPVGGKSTEYQLTLIRHHAPKELLGTHADKNEAMRRAVEHYGQD